MNLRNSGEASDFLTASEALESAADATPFEYDFLGKAIDTGFLIASFAKPERFVLSVQLAGYSQVANRIKVLLTTLGLKKLGH